MSWIKATLSFINAHRHPDEVTREVETESLKMVLHISIAVMVGLAALWAVNVPHHSFTGVMRQLIAIAVLAHLLIVVRRTRSQRRSDSEHISDALAAPNERLRAERLTSDTSEPSAKITAYDEQGRTPVERIFKS